MIDDEIGAEAEIVYESLRRKYPSPDAIPDDLWILPMDREPNTWYFYYDTKFAHTGGSYADSYILKTSDKDEEDNPVEGSKAYYFSSKQGGDGGYAVWYDGRWLPFDDTWDGRNFAEGVNDIPYFGFIRSVGDEDNRPRVGRMMVKLEVRGNILFLNWMDVNPLEGKQ